MATKTADASRTSQGGLHRVTVNLTPRAIEALNEACNVTGDSKTDTINRALGVYAYLQSIAASGGALYIRPDAKSEELERLHFL